MSTQSNARVQAGVPAGGQYATTARSEPPVDLGALERPLAEHSVVEIDTRYAEVADQRAKAGQRADAAIVSMRRAIGQRQTGYSARERARIGNDGWPTPAAAAEQEFIAQLAAGTLSPTYRGSGQQVADKLTDARHSAREHEATLSDLEEEFRRRGGWSRFFVVTSSSGGHVHSSTACSTCQPTTTFGWLPKLSGQGEQEAVEANGAILCTVCYPSAPTEWTDGRGRRDKDGNPLEDSTCPGSNQQPKDGQTRQFGRSTYGTCPECGESVTSGWSGLRKHKKPKPGR